MLKNVIPDTKFWKNHRSIPAKYLFRLSTGWNLQGLLVSNIIIVSWDETRRTLNTNHKVSNIVHKKKVKVKSTIRIITRFERVFITAFIGCNMFNSCWVYSVVTSSDWRWRTGFKHLRDKSPNSCKMHKRKAATYTRNVDEYKLVNPDISYVLSYQAS